MRTLRGGVLLTAVLGLLACVGCKSKEQTEKEKADLKKLEGKWRVATHEGDKQDPEAEDEEKKPDKADDKGTVYLIEGDVLTEKFNDKVIGRRRITLNPTREPAHIDLVRIGDDGKPVTFQVKEKGLRGKTKTRTRQIKEVGIYKLDGDKLTICSKWGDSGRPADFTASARSGRYLITLERVGGKPARGEDNPKDE